MNRFTIGCSAIALSALLSTAAHAQDQSEPADRSTNDIIVTAQFREQSLQDTPIAISALSADALEQKGASDITAAANIASLERRKE